MEITVRTRIGALTSGGDAQGMNAAVRATVRRAIQAGAEVFAIQEGWQGAITGSNHIKQMGWNDVSGVLNKGGTVIGTTHCLEFRDREGRRTVVRNLVTSGIDRLIMIGGDGSLTGTRQLRLKWGELLAELVSSGEVGPELVERHPVLQIAGLTGSIDNDIVGTDITIGTDSVLHRIAEAIDAIPATAESHRGTFIIEVMGRNCGYLALMNAIADGADYTFLPESPPRDGWEDRMVDVLGRGRQAGRRDSILVVVEGAADRQDEPITANRIRDILKEKSGEDARITILGHVQRGRKSSAYDRWMATAHGVKAVSEILEASAETEPVLVGVHSDRIGTRPLLASVAATRRVVDYIAESGYEAAISSRGPGFQVMIDIYRTITEAQPSVVDPAGRRVAITHAEALTSGIDQLVRVAVRSGIDLGYQMLAVCDGVPDLIEGNFDDVSWADVEGMAHTGGADFGARRYVPSESEFYSMARQLEDHRVDALLVMGGYHTCASVDPMERERRCYPASNIPVAVVPTSIDNSLPGWMMAIGVNAALNTVMDTIDMLRMNTSASKRAFIVKTMGRGCGFLPLVGGLAGGAGKAYLPEAGIILTELETDIKALVDVFNSGRNFYLAVVGEGTSGHYITDVLGKLYETKGNGRFSVRESVVGHLQQGGTPSPFNRINVAWLAWNAIGYLDRQLRACRSEYAATHAEAEGLLAPLRDVTDDMDWESTRPHIQWRRSLRKPFDILSRRPGQK